MGSTCTVSATYCHIVSGMINLIMQVGVSVHRRDGAVATESLRRFKKGNFVVKWNVSNCKFSEVRPGHSLEQLNGIGKRGGEILGIAKTPSALSRWALFYNHRSQIADTTHKMFGLYQEDKISHNVSSILLVGKIVTRMPEFHNGYGKDFNFYPLLNNF